ncbi:MAG: dihydroorotate dehydrogenase electron transfer subunit [Chromatiales bacterium]|jgi:dihydroorotate dehydrogenase electron transfer subunit
MTPDHSHRASIFQEDALILSHEAFEGDQHVLRLQAPQCAAQARAGQFVHLTVHPLQPLRRPISIMRVSAKQGWIDLLYKVVGSGTQKLAERQPGENISLLGPIGQPFHVTKSKPLLIGGGVGMPPMIYLADELRQDKQKQPFVILGSEVPFPFRPQPSQIIVNGLPDGVIAGMPLLDDWGIASRLASLQGYAGCFEGYVTDLARHWLESLDAASLEQVEIFSCGPHVMLEAVVNLARDFDVPVQVSLEEYMACGVGGCAGCVVEVQQDNGAAMKRVCVDGPVFDGYAVFQPTPAQ